MVARVRAKVVAQRVRVAAVLAFTFCSILVFGGRAEAQEPPADRCAASEDCARRGLCTEYAGRCMAGSDAECRAAEVCGIGRCTAWGGRCILGSRDDCRFAAGCSSGRCEVVHGACVDPTARFGEHQVSVPRSPRLASVGRWLTLTGVVAGGLGGVTLGVTLARPPRGEGIDGMVAGAGHTLGLWVGGVILVGGGLSLTTGAILWGVGASDVERPAVRVGEGPDLTPEVRLSPAGVDATWSF